MSFRILLALLLFAAGAAALDANGDTTYLARKLRPEWRFASLQDALDEVAKAAEKPCERSKRVLDQQKDALVVLVARQRWTLQEILVSLERTHGLRVTAGPLRLTVETEADARDRRRRPVQINLQEFAIAPVHDLPGQPLGHPPENGGGGGFDVFSGVEIDKHAGTDPVEILDHLRNHGGDATMEMRSSVAHLLVTPEEEHLMRAMLVERYQMAVRRGSWRTTFGLLPAGEALATGILDREPAAALASRLQQRSALTLALFNGQIGHAGATRQQALVQDAEVVNGMLDPVSEILATGRQAQLRITRGTNFDAVGFALDWIEPVTTRERVARLPASGEPESLSVKVEAAQDGKTPITASADAASGEPGQRLPLQLPEVWAWAPRGDIMLPRGKVLALCAPHGDETAVILFEEIP